MRIAIIEDEQVHRNLLEGFIRSWSVNREVALVIQQFDDAESFLFQWEDMEYDALFVDIQMSGMNGMELARQIRKQDEHITIIFTTGITDYLEEGYEVSAMRYLVKPISEEKVYVCLDKLAENRKTDRYVMIHTLMDEVQKVLMDQINYVEAMGHTSRIGMAYGQTIECKDSISELGKVLGTDEFQKCHRSYLCRIGNIHQIDKEQICFDDGSSIPVSRRMYQDINKAFIQYFRRDKR